MYENQFNDSSDRELAKLIALAQGSDAMYSIWLFHRLKLVYRQPNVDLLVIPKSYGLDSPLL